MFTGHGLSGQIQEALPIKNNPLSLVTENHFCANTVYVFVCVPLHFIFIVLHFYCTSFFTVERTRSF